MRSASGFRAAANNEDEAKNEEEENLLQVVPLAEETEKEESLEIPVWIKRSRSKSLLG